MKMLGSAALLIVLSAAGLFEPAQAQTPPVLLLRTLAPGSVELAWTNTLPEFILEQASTLDSSTRWQGVLQTPLLQGNVLTVTQSVNGAAGESRFFRLIRKGAPAALDYLLTRQQADGTWGDPSRMAIRDTSTALDALTLYGGSSTAFNDGLWALSSLATRNNDDLARKIISLAASLQETSDLLKQLLASQNAEISSSTASGFPGRGWGLAWPYDSTLLDTALALRAAKAGGRTGGLTIVGESLAAGATSTARSFELPAGATSLAVKVRSVSGSTIRLYLTSPSGPAYFTDLSPGTKATISGYPSSAGTWSMKVENRGAATASYTAEVGFTTNDGFDVFRMSTALAFLGLKQNADGGWGLKPDGDSHLMVTAEVIFALAAHGQAFGPQQVLTRAAAWVLAHQNADGGFSSVPSASNVQESSLATLALRLSDPAIRLNMAAAYLKSAQWPDGSWGGDAYLTALALRALHMAPVVSAIGNQSVTAPASFTPINLDDYVTDPDHLDSELTWTVAGNSVLTVTISNHVATVSYASPTNVTEQLLFTATDPDGYSGSATATFSVAYQSVDYTIRRGGSASGSRIFTGDSSVLDQTATYRVTQRNVPAGVTYTTTTVSRISATQVQVNFEISAGAGTATGTYEFEVEYELLNSSGASLGPLSGNSFHFRIEVTQ
jgi:hypothetical protein